MEVESVNGSNSNTGLYTSAAALVGGGAGAAAGWYSKPYLKDGAPTDSFIKKMDKNIKEAMSPEEKALTEALEKEFKGYRDVVANAKTVDELKNGFVNKVFEGTKDVDFKTFKGIAEHLSESFEALGIQPSPEYADKVRKTSNYEELKQVVSENFDKQYAGKSLDEIKQAIKNEGDEFNRKAAKGLFEQVWDSSKKQFVDCEEGIGKAIKKAARSIQGKAALIYGAVGAAVLGAATYLCCNNKK